MKTIIVAALLSAICISSRGEGLQLSGQYWQMKPSGTLSVGRDGSAGTQVDLADDLGFRAKDNVLGFELALGSGHEIVLSYLDAELSADSELTIPVNYGGTAFPASTRIQSELEAKLMRLAYRYQGGSHGFRGGFLLGVQQVAIKGSVTSSRHGSASADESAAAPVVGIHLRINPSSLFRIEAGLLGSVWDWEETHILFWDGSVSLRVDIRPFMIGIGYRQITLEAEDGGLPIEADVDFKGPFLEAGLVF